MKTNATRPTRSIPTSAIPILVGLFLIAAARALPAQLTAPTIATFGKKQKPAEPEVKATDVAESRREVATLLARVEQTIEAFKKENPEQQTPESLTVELELLKWLDLLYSNHAANLARKTELETELNRIREETEALQISPPDEYQQYSFLMLDDLRDKLKSESQRKASIELEIEAARSSLQSAKQAHDDSETARRLAREALHTTGANDSTNRNYALAKLRSRATSEAVRQRQLELAINELEQEISDQRSIQYRGRIQRMRGSVVFSQKELDNRIAATNKAESELRKQLDETLTNLGNLERKYLASTRALDNATEQTPVLIETAATWRMLRELNQEHVSVLQRVLTHAGTLRLIWRRRFDLANNRSTKPELAQWQSELEVTRSEIAQFQKLIEIRADERMGDMATVRKRLLTSDDMEPAIRSLLMRQADELEKAIAAYSSQIVLIKTAEQTLDRFREELTDRFNPRSAEEWLTRCWQFLQACWTYEITSVDDRPITVSKILWGTILLLTGVYSARIFSRILGTRLLPRFGLTQGASVAFQSIAYYMMVTCFGFVALEIINLPLTVFAFMGGAIAIGVGFGSQNVINNFISGLIMLAERPVRVGDLVDIEGLNGTIAHIGARSTRVRTGSNLEIIVPNSKFLENNVTNWTLSDTRIRTVVKVGVAYGSPVESVCRLLHQAVTEHRDVLRTPEPVILFKDFGDNSLMFEAHFWIHMRTVMEGERIASDVRVALDRLFGMAEITIAFPQRDVHVDTVSPIEVNLRQIGEQVDLGRAKAA